MNKDVLFRYCIDYMSKNKTFPNYKVLTSRFNTTQQDIFETFKILESEGKIKRNVGYRTLNKTKLNTDNKKTNNKIIIFKFIVLILSILSTYLSIHYNYIHFMNTINNKLVSFIMAVVIVGSIITIFEISLFYTGLTRLMLLIISILLLLFNITIITAGQYEMYIKNSNNNKINTKDVNDIVSNIEKQIEINNNKINEINKEKDRIDKIKYSFVSIDDQKNNINTIKTINRQLLIYNNEIDKLLESNNNLITQKTQINKDFVVYDFFVFMSTLNNKINSEILRFLILIFPSILFDIISCIGFVFILNKEEIK